MDLTRRLPKEGPSLSKLTNVRRIAEEQEKFNRELLQYLTGVPAGFNPILPTPVGGGTANVAEHGKDTDGWPSAKHRHKLDTTGIPGEITDATTQGAGPGVSLSGHTHKHPAESALASLYPIIRGGWRLEEALGSKRLDDFFLNDLTPSGGVDQAVGKIGNAALFARAGVQSLYILDSVQVGLDPGLGNWSISLWLYRGVTAGANVYYFLGKGANSNFSPEQTGYSIALTGPAYPFPNRIQVLFGAPPATTIGGYAVFNSVIPSAVWTHIVVTFARGGLMKLYVNGVQITALSDGFAEINHFGDNSGSCDTTAPFVVGGNSSVAGGVGVQTFEGRLDAVYPFNDVLTPAQVNALYNNGNGRELVPLWLARTGGTTPATPGKVQQNGVDVGTRPTLNFRTSLDIDWQIADDPAANAVRIEATKRVTDPGLFPVATPGADLFFAPEQSIFYARAAAAEGQGEQP